MLRCMGFRIGNINHGTGAIQWMQKAYQAEMKEQNSGENWSEGATGGG